MILYYRFDKIPLMSTRTIEMKVVDGKKHPGIVVSEVETRTSKYSSLIDLINGLGHERLWRTFQGLTGITFAVGGGYAFLSDAKTIIDNTTLDNLINTFFHFGTLTAGAILLNSARRGFDSIRQTERQINTASINFPQE